MQRDGVRVGLRMRPGTKIPKDVKAFVGNRSAVGEQYVDLLPKDDNGPFLHGGETILYHAAAGGVGLVACQWARAIGVTMPHPHGQIYAFEFVPELPRRELLRGTRLGEPGTRLVAEAPGWCAWVPEAPVFPYAVRLAPDDPVADLPMLDGAGRNALSALLVDVLERFDRLFEAETPYMLWIHQRPFDGRDWPGARLHVEIVTPWRAPGVQRYVAAGELGSGVYFNPVAPEAAAQALRDAV